MMEVNPYVRETGAVYGPYRATKLWNEVIVAFRHGMPVSRHRRYMKTYEGSFSATEAVNWLLNFLRNNPNFGVDVTRLQTIQLLRKLHRARVLEDVRGGKNNKSDLVDNGRLFRLTLMSSPLKTPGRVPFTDRKDLINHEQPPQFMGPTKQGRGPPTPPRLCLSPQNPTRKSSPQSYHSPVRQTYPSCTENTKSCRSQTYHETENAVQLRNQIQRSAPLEKKISPRQRTQSYHNPEKHISPERQVHSLENVNRVSPPHKLQSHSHGGAVPLRTRQHNSVQPNLSIPACRLVAKQLSVADVETTWKHMTLDRLQEVLDLDNLKDILDETFVIGKYIMHNCIYLNKNGIVTNIEPKDQLPHWAMSAMKCLAHWPEKIDDNLPTYVGFEKDVFRVVKDYFCALSEPLMTYEMYEVVTNVFVTAGGRQQSQFRSQTELEDNPDGLTSFESVENLMLNLTNVGSGGKSYNRSKSTPDAHRQRLTSASVLDLSPIAHIQESFLSNGNGSRSSLRRCESSASLPVAKYETAFGPENRTVTRVYYRDGVSTEFGYTNGPEELSKTPLETHFESPPKYERLLPMTDKCQGAYNVNFARVKSMRRRKSEGHLKLSQGEKTRRRSYECSTALSSPEDGKFHTAPRNRTSSGGQSDKMRQRSNEYSTSLSSPEEGQYRSAPRFRTRSKSTTNSQYSPQSEDEQCSRPRTFSGGNVLSNISPVNGNTSSENFQRQHAGYVNGAYQQDSRNQKYNNMQPRPPVRRDDPLPPHYKSPPHYSTLFPNGYKPVIDGTFRPLGKCHKSKSNVSLHRVKSASSMNESFLNSQSQHNLLLPAEGLYPEQLRPSRPMESKESLYGRSLSMSDLLHGEVEAIQGKLKRVQSSVSLSQEVITERRIKALQLVCLLLPPANRRKLHLLLKMMSKMSNNVDLHLDNIQTTKALILETFYRSVLSSQEEADMEDLLVMSIVEFLLDHCADIMAAPRDLKAVVEDRLNHMNKAQLDDTDALSIDSGIVYSLDDPSSLHYCQQVSVAEYEKQRLSNSQRAMAELLEEIICDKSMAPKDKKRRLKTFAKTYPEIYARRFPTVQSETEAFPAKPKIKQPLLAKPLLKLRGLRI